MSSSNMANILHEIDMYFNFDSEPPDVRDDNFNIKTRTSKSLAGETKRPRISNNIFKIPLRYLINVKCGLV